MPTYFDTIGKVCHSCFVDDICTDAYQNFASVEVGPEGIDTIEFLEACDSLSQMFSVFIHTRQRCLVLTTGGTQLCSTRLRLG